MYAIRDAVDPLIGHNYLDKLKELEEKALVESYGPSIEGLYKKEIDSLAPDLADRLLEYPFPGNVRELENIIASAILLEKGKILTLPSAFDLTPVSGPAYHPKEDVLTLEELEKRHMREVLKLTNGNRTRAAKILGIGLRTLQRKLKACGDSKTTPQ